VRPPSAIFTPLPDTAAVHGGVPEPAAGPPQGLALVSYPLLLDAASLLARAEDLARATPGAFAEVHPDDAARLGLEDGSTVELDFGDNRAAQVPLRVAPTTAPGCVFVPSNQPDLALGALLGPARSLRVEVRPAAAAGASRAEGGEARAG
jgi:anaerobic selenocysteine-containing dehydrogenase